MQWVKWFLVYMNILTQSIAITDSMFNFGNFLTKNAITFDQKEIERKKKISRRHEILLRIQFCHQKCQNHKKKINFFPKIFLTKSPFFKKNTDFLENIKYIFRFWRFFPSFWLLIYLFRSNNKAMNQIFPTSCWIHEKIWKSCQLYILRPPLRLNHDPRSKIFFCHTVLNYFIRKVPNAQ